MHHKIGKQPPLKLKSEMLIRGFVLLASLTMMNMMVGVLCNLVSAVAEAEREGRLAAIYGKL